MNYTDFIESKALSMPKNGFTPNDLHDKLKDFQKHIIKTACERGKYAIFADCGMGKTFMQIEWARQVWMQTNEPVIIVAPLAVVKQTRNEMIKWYGEELPFVIVTNYEQLPNIAVFHCAGVVLDESSILKNFDGKTKRLIIDKFQQTRYKLACTATPSPNDPMELGNHAEFLDVMKYNEMLAMYFIHDGGATQKWRLKKHGVKRFYQFVSTWATMIHKPSDIGFDDEGYILPNLNFIEHEVKTPPKDNGLLFNETSVSATDFNKELRITLVPRIELAAQIINESKDNFIVWFKQNKEGDELRKLIPDMVEVRGSDRPEDKANKLIGFGQNEFRVLGTKTKIAQFGLNYQNCHNQVFASLDFSFEGLYQAIRRSWRFGQNNEVNIYIITTDTMQNVIQKIKEKQDKFNQMRINMKDAINEESTKTVYNGDDVITDHYHIMKGDCVARIKEVPDESIGLSVFSPPFAELYTFSDSIEDMSNSKDYNEFLTHFKFLTSELYRVIMQGRNVCVHCMDLPIQKGKEGFIGLRDFSGMMIDAFTDAGFIYHSRITIWKNPAIEMQRTKAIGLLHKQVKKDSTMSRVGIPDYVLVFRKDGERNNPVQNTGISVDEWQKIASPVWMDIDYGNTLNGRDAKHGNDEKHIVTLQLDTIKRLIQLYSNKGDTVFTPFGGIMSEVYQAIKMGRYGKGIELKDSYFEIGKKNCKDAALSLMQASLF